MDDEPGRPVLVPLTRRRFLAASAAGVGVVAAASALTACGDSNDLHAGPPAYVPYSPVPDTPMSVPDSHTLQFFSPSEGATVDALASRILPGDASDPGAHEAGVLRYIDLLMASTKKGSAKATYTDAPFAKAYEGDTAPPTTPDQVPVPKAELDRYGPQSKQSPREIYQAGLVSLDAAAMMTHGSPFAALAAPAQDDIVQMLSDGTAPGFTEPSADTFFKTVRQHVIEGMFSDPVYGGNFDMLGWKLIGYPGPWRAWNDADLLGKTPLRPMEDITKLHGYEAGEPQGGAIEPVSGAMPEMEG